MKAYLIQYIYLEKYKHHKADNIFYKTAQLVLVFYFI